MWNQPVKEYDDLYNGYVGAVNVAVARNAAKAERERAEQEAAELAAEQAAADLSPRVPRSWRLRHALSVMIQS